MQFKMPFEFALFYGLNGLHCLFSLKGRLLLILVAGPKWGNKYDCWVFRVSVWRKASTVILPTIWIVDIKKFD